MARRRPPDQTMYGDRSSGASEEEGVRLRGRKNDKDDDDGLADLHSVETPRWRTAEFLVYYCFFIIIVPMMVKCAVELSLWNTPQYPRYEKLLSKGWIFGLKIDNSDHQYASFRNNILHLAGACAAHLALSTVVRRLPFPKHLDAPGPRSPRVVFNVAFSAVFLWVLYGTNCIRVYAELVANYAIARTCRASRRNPILTWALNLFLLYGNERWGAAPWATVSDSLAFLDNNRGMMPRWFITFNITQLRMISFNVDLFWSTQQSVHSLEETHLRTCRTCNLPRGIMCDRFRTEHPADPRDYNFVNYIAYTIYAPLFQAGPISSFNSWMSQIRSPPQLPLKSTVLYGVRFVGCYLLMELLLHTIYVQALSREKAWGGLSPFQMAMVGYWGLKYVWLKLLIIWRFFRLWALLDGVDTVENMHRCMSNNYSAQGFWRGWHRSYNRWLVRYLYVPLGGTSARYIGMPLVFAFVAFWHDRTMQLLAWSWLIVVFLVPEGVATWVFRDKKWRSQWWFRHLCACGGVINILMMMAANLVGFAVGVDGAREMVEKIFSGEGAVFLVVTFASLFAAVQVMFEIRNSEARRDNGTRY
ncbi:glycerol transporter [Gonapodya prolifera JEL478]|uniref:Glycerol transporter n=1 Tax=Gonapodya prolifera (strain JEL478) TaxID=1344416 RepID=A0A139AUM3_GONPJ|nr:glycerol transporter [Gonapodya prolifera JEL478]|eukprot:KXS20273.1 glycerol transporter [Gonapodya prolifera JEL478]